jgi:hypothetical protein
MMKAALKARFDKMTRENKMKANWFLFGILAGVIMAAVVTYTLAIPATNDLWRVEIVKRGGGTWYFDKKGHLGWKWTVEPVVGGVRSRTIVVPRAQPVSDSSPREF